MIEDISKPRYLKKKKKPLRILISIGLILLMFCIMNPFLLISVPVYLVYVIKAVKNNKNSDNILIDKAIDAYYSQDFKQSLEYCEKIITKQEEEQVRLLIALNLFMLGKKKEFAEIILSLKNNEVNADADIQIKLGEALEEVGELKQAEEVYRKLISIFPKSKYLNEKVLNISTQND